MEERLNNPTGTAAPTTADVLLIGPDIVTFDHQDGVILDGALAITGNAISWIGKAGEAKTIRAGETIEASGQIAMPGITDAHYHTGQQFLRGIHRVTHRRGPVWKKTLIPFESGLSPEDVHLSGLVGYTSMISSGTTCFLEAGGPHPDEMGRAADEVGIRGRIALNTCDMDGPGGPLPKTHVMSTRQALQENEALVKRWQDHPRVNAWLSLRQIIVNTEELRVGMWHLAEELGTYIHTHLSEGTYEVDYTVENYLCRPPEYFEKLGIFNQRMHCAHSIYLTPGEIDLYANHDVSVCHCAFNNYSYAPHRLFDMVRKGIRVGLGTDGPMRRGSLDMFQVCHYATMGQTIGYGTPFHAPPPISYAQMLRQACRGGAAAAHLSDKLGTLEIGKLADIVLVGHDDFDQIGSIDPTITLGQNGDEEPRVSRTRRGTNARPGARAPPGNHRPV
jgi:5-methylthioadenosine/S-adenosylhomocysteine deaminase